MFNIVVCSDNRRAEKYCLKKNLPEIETVIVMFSSEIDFYLMRCNNKQIQAKVHDLNNKIIYTVKNIESL